MAGRWRMASVQMSFAIMPALVYWFAGETSPPAATRSRSARVVAFTTLQTRLLFPIQSLLSVGLEVQTSLALFGRIFEYLDLPVDIVERPDARDAAATCAATCACRTSGFRYDARRAVDAARTSTPRSRPGTRTALVGETGSGKTTLAYLVARLYEPERGCVSIDGVDIRDADARLAGARRSASSRRRPTCSTPRSARTCASPARTRPTRRSKQAARAAQIHDLIASLPDGYDTPVGERGYRFSGGEKQRIAIARTVLRNPPVLILDEATSRARQRDRARRPAGARRARRAGARRSRSPTASRRSATPTRSSCSTHGRIVERGTHEELLARGGRYAALAARAGEGEADEADALVA